MLVSARVDVPRRDDAAAVDDHDVLADILDELELMAREQHRRAAGRLAAQQLGEPADSDGIEPRERLVEHKQVGFVLQRRRQLGALLVTCESSSNLAPARSARPSRSSQSNAAARAAAALNPCRLPK
jgi:hypothetical protein